jgi:hypothetical protein
MSFHKENEMKQQLPPCVQRTNDIETARARLTKFVLRKASDIVRNTGISYEETNTSSLYASTYEEVIENFNRALSTPCPYYVMQDFSDSTIYTDPSANHAFRFWHDWLHYKHKLDFSTTDEKFVGHIQTAAVIAEFGLGSLEAQMMYLDTVGQVEYFASNNAFVENQLEWTLRQLSEGRAV